MNILDKEMTLLTPEDFFSLVNDFSGKAMSPITDLAILLGAIPSDVPYACVNSLKGRTCDYYLDHSSSFNLDVKINKRNAVDKTGRLVSVVFDLLNKGIRPIISFDSLDEIKKLLGSSFIDINGRYVGFVNFGEYPQYITDSYISNDLEKLFKSNSLKKTGKKYTFSMKRYRKDPFVEDVYDEFEYDGNKYIRLKNIECSHTSLSNRTLSASGMMYAWIKVEQIEWIIDKHKNLLISKNVLMTGFKTCDVNNVVDDFKKSEMYYYLNKYLKREILSTEEYVLQEKENINDKKVENPYGFFLDEVSEEEIIKGCIESDIAVFLHGKSSEGKSQRVKQIDSDCIIIYLRNATPESLNGKSVYNQSTGEMIDIKPSWLIKLEERCQREPDKLHILFFDELTNALPSIQGMVFNIILDKEVNGKWHLPSNARIVAAGNDLNDSKAVSEMAEPLFNRFAHVYIKTTPEKWLKWASENNIHPLIYGFIAYQKEAVLRTEYNGITPNADPRKWEMASHMLYKTNNPHMLRSLIGEETTDKFINFCNQYIITLEDVINNNYHEEYLSNMTRMAKYATVFPLTLVKEENYELVRNFVSKLGDEFVSLFDATWSSGNKERLIKVKNIRNNQ